MATSEADLGEAERTLRVATGDLLIGGRVAGHGRDFGYRPIPGLRLRREDWERIGSGEHRLVIDLEAVSLTDWQEEISRLDEDARARVAGYASHVRLDLLKQARAAKLGAVWTRSQLDERLPGWLAEGNRR